MQNNIKSIWLSVCFLANSGFIQFIGNFCKQRTFTNRTIIAPTIGLSETVEHFHHFLKRLTFLWPFLSMTKYSFIIYVHFQFFHRIFFHCDFLRPIFPWLNYLWPFTHLASFSMAKYSMAIYVYSQMANFSMNKFSMAI